MNQSACSRTLNCLLGIFVVLCAATGSLEGQESENVESAAIEFFESDVLPILKKHCWECHGADAESLSGSLALISRKSILAGGDSGSAVDLKNPGDSLLLAAINYEAYEMPPSGKLPAADIATITRWLEMGLPWSAETADAMVEPKGHAVPQVNSETKSFWSFQKVQRPDPPEVANSEWATNDIDRFVLARLEKSDLSPAPPVSKQQLVRRVHYDLTGLPPTPEQVAAFGNDGSEDAYERLVEQLLDSPHYGEKWARHWLDVVRYAESNSFERDGTKPFVWRYRDYVINAFNDDKPYDQFLIEQLAGDQLEEPTNESIIATGYYRLGQWDDEPADSKQALFDDLDDVLATTSQAMLGLTVNCARCHDHKIEPIPTEDYYRMLAYFRNIRRYGIRGHDSVLAASTRILEHDVPPAEEVVKKYEQQVANLAAEQQEIVELAREHFEDVEHEEFQYKENQERILHGLLQREDIARKQFDKWIHLRNQLRHLNKNPPHLFRVLCVKEHDSPPPATHVLVRGNPHAPDRAVEPGTLSVLKPGVTGSTDEPFVAAPDKRRLALARWIASPDNPLTARVMVNRIWQHHFGRGIVRSSNDFGFQGDKPTHPDLLAWLASEFTANGWRIKDLHRKILLSSTYRMSGRFSEIAYEKDPLNNLFWKFDMRRLTAEELRDSILAVSGRLNLAKKFGPSIFVKLSQEVLSGQSMPGNGWGNSPEQDQLRRSIYIHVKRSLRVPLLESFDAADTDFTCPVRFNTTQPTQALGLLNSEFVNSEAREFAKLVSDEHDDLRDQVREVLLRTMQREPLDAEIDEGIALIKAWREQDGVSKPESLAFFCLTAFNLNEFLFVD